jgi:hypothetical protein
MSSDLPISGSFIYPPPRHAAAFGGVITKLFDCDCYYNDYIFLIYSIDTLEPTMLYLVGLGLADETDITVKGLEVVKKAERVYLEAYTSILLVNKEKLVSVFGYDTYV